MKATGHEYAVRQAVLTGTACLTAFISGCSGREARTDVDSSAVVVGLDSLQSLHDITVDAREWADSIMATMTVEEMAGQLIMPSLFSDDSAANLRMLREYAVDCHVGGVVLLKGTVEAADAIAETLRGMLGVPPFIAIDAEWGLAMRLYSTPEFPRNGRISPSADENAMFDYGFELAHECRQAGVNMVLGPVLDVLPEGNGRSGIGTRSFGSDPERVAALGVAYAKGLESGGVISVAKHFPGHGSADADSHRRLPAVRKTRGELEATDLLPFRAYIDNGMSALMTGHLYVPALEEEEIPVTVSEKILTEFVRDSLGFQGLVLTDAINMAGAGGYSAADAIVAGADLVLSPADTKEELRRLTQAVMEGHLPMQTLRDRVRRVLFHKYMVAKDGGGSGKVENTSETERIIKLLR